MPSADHETTLARQWELLRNHLPSRPPGRTSKDLRDRLQAAGHNVKKRTVERDMVELSRIFPIVRNEKGVPYGWHWRENARFDVLGMDLSEAVSLGLMEDVLRQIMPPAFLSALEGKFSLAREKLSALPKIPHARWKDLVRYIPPGMPFIPPTIAPGVLPSIQEALLQQRRLQVFYNKPGADEAKEYNLHPLSLIQQGARSYLVASAFDYDTPSSTLSTAWPPPRFLKSRSSDPRATRLMPSSIAVPRSSAAGKPSRSKRGFPMNSPSC